jgi:putative tricarboxylic transport membrane protein
LRQGTRIVAGAFRLLGLFMVSQAPGYRLMSSNAGAGPGLLPMLAGLGIIASSLSIIFVSSKDEPIALAPDIIPDRDGALRVAGVLFAYAAVIVFIQSLGYCLTIFAFLMATMWILGRRDLPLMLAVSLLFSFGVYWVFTKQLMVILPQGMLGF